MKLLGKTKAYQEAFFNLQRMPVYMPANYQSRWFLTDTEANFEKAKGLSSYSIEDVSYEFNSNGFRSIEFTHDPEAINVLVVGESNSIGVGLPFDHIWFNSLANQLRDKHGLEKVKFFNMSMSGITLDYMAMLIDQAYDALRPDFVIVLGTTFFASTYFMSEDRAKSEDFLCFSLTSVFNPDDGKIAPDKTFIPPELHDLSFGFTRDLNLANCFFKSFMAYSFIKRICQGNFFVYFRNPKVYNLDLTQEILKYDSDFLDHFIQFPSNVFSPMSCSAPNFARDGIHVGKSNHDLIAEVIENKLNTHGIIQKWQTQLIGDQYDLDSLSIVEMYLFIEDEFGITIPEEDRKMKITLSDLVAVVEKYSK